MTYDATPGGPNNHYKGLGNLAKHHWPTPHGFSQDGKSNGPSGNELGRAVNRSLWPTPDTPNGGRSIAHADEWRGNTPYFKGKNLQVSLDNAVKMACWPAPTSRDWKDGSAQSCANVPPNGLLGRVVHFPTPTANRRDGLQSHGVNVVSGSLNPTRVEWLMGFPLGWTALEPSETPSSRKSRK